MFRFESPNFLYVLIAIPLLTLLYFLAIRKTRKRIATFGEKHLMQKLVIGFSKWRSMWKFELMMLGMALIITAIARPQFGTQERNVTTSGIEVLIAIDISNSMLATDISPNRLARAKALVSHIIDKLDNDKVGLVVFAGDAYIQLPLTTDHTAAKMLLEGIAPNNITGQGTNVAAALDLSQSVFSKDKEVGRAVILITDGENHEAGAREAAEKVRKQGVNLFVLGIGTTEGAPIPLDGRYITDENGNTVMSALNETMCRELAQSGGGEYVRVDNSMSAQDRVLSNLSKLKKSESGSIANFDYAEQFQAFVLLALIILAIDMIIKEREGNLFTKLKLFDKK